MESNFQFKLLKRITLAAAFSAILLAVPLATSHALTEEYGCRCNKVGCKCWTPWLSQTGNPPHCLDGYKQVGFEEKGWFFWYKGRFQCQRVE